MNNRLDKNKYLRKLKFKRLWRRYEKYVYLGVSCLVIAILGIYFAHSKFSASSEEEVIRTVVGNFIHGDVVIGAYIDGEYSLTIPGKDDGYVVKNVVCDNDAVGKWDDDKWGLLTTNMTKRTKCNIYFETKKLTVNETIANAMSSSSSMFASDDPDNNIRYIGKNPDNYVYFNCSDYNNQSDNTCEKWRIIGVFNNIINSDDLEENLVKIIRDERLNDTDIRWDYKQTGVGTSTTTYGSNDWTDSQLMMMLNPTNYLESGYTNSNDIISLGSQQLYSKMGSYYNGTKGCKPASIASGASFSCTEIDFTSTGLKNDTTRNAIEEVVWNLGGVNPPTWYPTEFYTEERGTTVYSGHATTWTGKIGLMYPSDYGYATAGGSTTNRATCLSTEFYNWDSYSDCYSNNYLYKSDQYQWTLSPYSFTLVADAVFLVYTDSLNNSYVNGSGGVRPALYLKSNITINTGNGSSSSPYQLNLE